MKMSCRSNWHWRFLQYYCIFFGFTYTYVDIENRQVKFHKFVKIYVYIINLLFLFILYYFISTIQFLYYFGYNNAFDYVYYLLHFVGIFVLAYFFVLRIKEENTINKWLEIFSLQQTRYFDKIINISIDKNPLLISMFTFIMIIVYNFYTIYVSLPDLVDGEWSALLQSSVPNIYIILEHHVLLQHGLILCYINYCFSQLNNQLQYGRVHAQFLRIHLYVSLLLEQMNKIYGPIIFCILFSQIVTIGLIIHGFIELALDKFLLIRDNLFELTSVSCLSINIILYFLICERLHKTTTYTGQILMEFIVNKTNEEVLFYFSYLF